MPYLSFTLGSERFAIGIMNVREIIEYPELTDVPMMAPCMRGVLNLRGAAVTVMDLAQRFGWPLAPVTRRSCVVIVELGSPADGRSQVIGVVVDAVNAVLDIAPEQVEPAPAFGARIARDFIAGMAKVEGRFVILIDVARVFCDRDLQTALDAAAAS
ncbi:chemotaxis protein CheW [Noviherbaspirillum humi]|nr:chemotaxis protein CheW [Noviherbaspirillum humi]